MMEKTPSWKYYLFPDQQTTLTLGITLSLPLGRDKCVGCITGHRPEGQAQRRVPLAAPGSAGPHPPRVRLRRLLFGSGSPSSSGYVQGDPITTRGSPGPPRRDGAPPPGERPPPPWL